MIEQPLFGQRVREARRRSGLSQAQIAGTEMSASYISLVESGRRTPSIELARTIADRLGVPLGELTAPEGEPQRRGWRLQLVGQLIAASSARTGGDPAAARDKLLAVIEQASDPEHEDIAWEARCLLAEVLIELGDNAQSESLLRELVNHPITTGTAHLRARVAGLLAELARQAGRLQESAQTAKEALESAQLLDATSTEKIQLQLTLTATLAVLGEHHQAQAVANDLVKIVSDVVCRQQRATILWTAAGAHYLSGHATRALDLLDRAFEQLTPAVDLRRWAALCRSAAAMRLSMDDTTREADNLLRWARQVLELAGRRLDILLLTGIEALMLLRNGNISGALDKVAALEETDDVTPLHQAGLLVATARVRGAARQTAEATSAYRRAAALYEQAGAYKPALEIWRELSEFMESGSVGPSTAEGWHAIALP
ncbi:MAG TPA: helix-turn-helix domain-containing protein [Micromonospora sp.]